MTASRNRGPMKALTLWRPWSDLIVDGWKPVENRDWTPPPALLGQFIAIHAGKRYDEDITLVPGRAPVPEPEESPLGIVGVARLVGYLDTRKGRSPRVVAMPGADEVLIGRLRRLDEDPWFMGPCGWLLDSQRRVEPIPCRGSRKLWDVPSDLREELRRRYAAAAPAAGAHAS